MLRRSCAKTSVVIGAFCFAFVIDGTYGQSTAVSSVAPPSTIYDFEPLGKKPPVEEVEPLVGWLPIWGRSAKEKGFDLPLSLGIGLTYTYIHQNMVVSDVRIKGHPLNLNIHDAATITHTGVARLDAWIFPFLNIYGIIGETSGVTKPELEFSDGEVLKSSVDYNRFSYGAGMTLAGGWKSFFGTLDTNWTTGPIVSTDKGQIGDEPINSLTISPRLGIIFSSGQLGHGALWVGGMCLIATSEIHDAIDLSGRPRLSNLIDMDSINFSVHVEPKDNWNMLIGGNWEFNKHWSLTAELGGVEDRFHTIGAITFRF